MYKRRLSDYLSLSLQQLEGPVCIYLALRAQIQEMLAMAWSTSEVPWDFPYSCPAPVSLPVYVVGAHCH